MRYMDPPPSGQSASPDAAVSWDAVVGRVGHDAESLTLLYEKYYDPIFRHCFYRVFDRHLAEDLTSETFLRVAFPEHFPPGWLLGSFVKLCDQRLGTPQEILGQADTQELRDLNEYARRYHHETNDAWRTEAINDRQLEGFVGRALNFAKR